MGITIEIGWVKKKEGFLAVIEFEATVIGKILDGNAIHAGIEGPKGFDNARAGGASSSARARNAEAFGVAAEGNAVAHQPAGRPLDFSEARLGNEVVKILPRIQYPLEFLNQCGQMILDIAIEINEVTIEIVDDLDGTSLLGQQHRQSPGEGFAIAGVGWDQGKDFL